jgi:prefoldin subunit 5
LVLREVNAAMLVLLGEIEGLKTTLAKLEAELAQLAQLEVHFNDFA